MLDGNKLGKDIWRVLKAAKTSQKPEEHWIKVASTICDHIASNAEVSPGIEVSTSGGSGATTGKGKIG